MKKVAVITRTKDRPVFLKRAIESVHNQTYTDFTHVIVNDGGDRNEIQSILDGLAENVRIKIELFHREKSSGAPDTIFNESIDRVDSEYIAIHDDDDTWHKEFLEKSIEVLNGGAQGVVVRIDNKYESLEDDRIVEGKTTRHMPHMRAISLYDQCLDNQLTAGAFIYRRSAYEKVGKYDSKLPVAGDWEFGLRFLQEYDVDYLDPGYALAYYHRHSDVESSFTAHNHRKYLNLILNKYLRNDIKNGGLGLGYIMNSRWSERDKYHGLVKRVTPKHIHNIVRRLR